MGKTRRKKPKRKYKKKAKGLTQQEKEKINSTLKNKNLKTLSLSSKYHELPSELQKKIELNVKYYLKEEKKNKEEEDADPLLFNARKAHKKVLAAREKQRLARLEFEKARIESQKAREKINARKYISPPSSSDDED